MQSTYGFEEHGGISPAELSQLGLESTRILDFSVNSNPFGPAELVWDALQQVDVSRYPDRYCWQLREELARLNQVQPEQVLVGNGTAELIWLACHALLQKGESVVVLGPTFGEYRRAAEQVGGLVCEIRAKPPRFEPPLDELLDQIQRCSPRLVFVCNPNNPTGSYLTEAQIRRIAAACPPGTHLILDEAYRFFVDGEWFGRPPGSVLVMRSMTKDFALAGLRLGYAIGSPEVIAGMQRVQPVWSVNGMAQAAGLAALQSLAYYRQTFERLVALRRAFFEDLIQIGCELVASAVHFTLIRTRLPARQMRQKLLQHAVLVRDCTSFGLSDYVRVSTQREEDNRVLVELLKRLIERDETD